MPLAGRSSVAMIALRGIISAAIVTLTLIARFVPPTKLSGGTRWTLLAIVVGLALTWILTELLKLGLERLVGFRYLHRRRRDRGAIIGLAAGLALMVASGVLFAVGHHLNARGSQIAGLARGLQTAGVSGVLTGAQVAMWSFLLRVFSVFTTVSTVGVVYGVASLVVVFGVTSGFEREFQDKVLALNAHLIVQAYGDADFEEMNDIQKRLKDMPGVVRMAPFLFSAGEVMIGRIGANLKGIDLTSGADDLRRALVAGHVEDLAVPATCPLPNAIASSVKSRNT